MAQKNGIKVAIIGDRECTDYKLVENAVKESKFEIKEIVSGAARGGDTLGEEYAKNNKIKVKQFKPNWNDISIEGAVIKEKINPWTKKLEKYNSLAGFQRNSDIVDYSDAIIALQPNGPTNGTQDTIKKAKKKGIPIFIYPSSDKREYKRYF